MSERRCGDCEFWTRLVNDRNRFGVCHRFPPTVISDEDGGLHSETDDDDWCGEFIPRAVKESLTTAAPPKFRVGDTVTLGDMPSGWRGVVKAVEAHICYRVQWDEGGVSDYAESELAAAEDASNVRKQ